MPEEASLCVYLQAFSSPPVLPGAWNRSMDFVDQSYLCVTGTCHEIEISDYLGRHRNRSSRVEVEISK